MSGGPDDAVAYLAIDLGAESGRAMVGTLAGERLALDEVHRFPHGPVRLPSGLHWDVTGLWREVLEGARRAVRFAAERGVRLAGMGVDTWGVDYGLVGASGALLSLPHCYRDERNQAAFERIVGAVGSERLYAATGNQLMALNTLFQLVAQQAAEPELVARADRLLFMPDLLHFFLTGRARVEATIASTSQMVDPHLGQWAYPLLETLGLPAPMFREIVPSGTPLGPVLPHVQEEIGATDPLAVIAPAAHDTASAVAAVPAPADGSSWCYLSSGTWSLLGTELDGPCLTDAARDAPFTNEAGVAGTVRFLRNMTGLWLVQECRRSFGRGGRTPDYGELTTLAARAAPLRTLVDPDHAPFAAPGGMPEKIADFARATGQPEPADAGALVRCGLESLALSYRHVLGQLESVLGRRFDAVHVVGGGARNDLLNQMTADATGRPVHVGPHEATAIGNVLVQAMGTGRVKDLADLRRIVRASFPPVVVEPRETAAWDRAYERYQELRSAAAPIGAGGEGETT